MKRNLIMSKIKLALAFFAGLVMASCSDSDEAVLYDNYDFMSIKGDSVISADGLQMVASVVEIYQIDSVGTFSEITSQVTVGNNVFDVNLYVDGSKKGKHTMKLGSGDRLGEIGYVKYRKMLRDSTFKTDKYAITSSVINWSDVNSKEVLFDVTCHGRKMLNDSTYAKPQITLEGKIRAIKR